MWATGLVVADRAGVTAALVAEARERFTAGPPPWTDAERDRARYHLSDLVDDLVVAPPAEVGFVALDLVRVLGEYSLRAAGAWSARGKWLARELSALDPDLAVDLHDGHTAAVAGDPGPLAALAGRVLECLGGRLLEGYSSGPVPGDLFT
jgi:hypothetical protein